MQVTARMVCGIVLFSVAMSAVVLGNKFQAMMIGEINRRRPDDNQVSYFGFTLPKVLRINDEYHRLYPRGRLHVYYWVAGGVSTIGLIGVGICVGVFG